MRRARRTQIRNALLGTITPLAACGIFVVAQSSTVENAAVVKYQDYVPGAEAVVRMVHRERQSNVYTYEVRVQNTTAEPLSLHSTIIALEHVINTSTGENILYGTQVSDHDGRTIDGRPFFKLPLRNQGYLAPQSWTDPLTVRLRIPHNVRYFYPVFRVHGGR